jgi:hypothetical protein
MLGCRPLALALSIALVAVGVAGCSSYVKRGAALYADGRYVEAAEVYERTEARLPESSPRQRAEYGLYRGLTLLVLGDLRNAHRWLTYAYDVERAAPGSLGTDRRMMLDRGWRELGQRTRVGPPHTTPTAVAARQPEPPAAPTEPVAPPSSGSESGSGSGSGRSSDGAVPQRTLVPH